VLATPPRSFLSAAHARRLLAQGLDATAIDAEVAARTAARARGDFDEADAIKRRLDALGVELRDGPTDTKWSVRAASPGRSGAAGAGPRDGERP
jgi:cysteinyl-tRNA synthetase